MRGKMGGEFIERLAGPGIRIPWPADLRCEVHASRLPHDTHQLVQRIDGERREERIRLRKRWTPDHRDARRLFGKLARETLDPLRLNARDRRTSRR